MPVNLKKLKNGYNYENDFKNTSKQLELIVKNNFKKKDYLLKEHQKHYEGGIIGSLNKFDKKIKEKIKNI
jgi:hypothetical protein